MTSRTASLLICAVALVVSACSRTPQHQAVIRHAAAVGDFDTSAQRLNQLYGSSLATDPEGRERLDRKHGILWTLDRGILAVLGGNYASGFALLGEGSALVEALRTRWTAGNISRSVGSAAVNETLSNYEGSAFEHVQMEFWRSLNEVLQAQFHDGITGSAGQRDGGAVHQHYSNAISFARRMVLNQIQEGQDAADGTMWRRTYYDDPFARLYAAALMLAVPRDQRAGSDLQFADVMLKRAWAAYRDERAALSGQRAYRYEAVAAAQNQALVTLLHRVGLAYDPSGWASWAERNGVPPAMPIRLGDEQPSVELPADHGMLLVLNLADLISFPQALDIVAAAGTVSVGHRQPRHSGEQAASFRIGAISFYARGPGAEVVNFWPVFPVPPQLTQALAPGGLAFIGTSVPVHVPDRPSPAAATIEVASDGAALSASLQVLSDLDAYARATLKDEQPRILIRALVRTAAKQTAAALAAREAKKEFGPLAGLLVGMAGSGLATWSEVADVRGPLLLPDTIQGSLIDVPAGSHHLHLQHGAQRQDLGQITVPAGRLVVVLSRSFPNPPPAPGR